MLTSRVHPGGSTHETTAKRNPAEAGIYVMSANLSQGRVRRAVNPFDEIDYGRASAFRRVVPQRASGSLPDPFLRS